MEAREKKKRGKSTTLVANIKLRIQCMTFPETHSLRWPVDRHYDALKLVPDWQLRSLKTIVLNDLGVPGNA